MNIYSLIAATIFAMLVWRIATGRAIADRFTTTLKAILPSRLFSHSSVWLDFKIFYLNAILIIAAGSLFGLSSEGLRHAIYALFGRIHEIAPQAAAPTGTLSITLTVAAFIGVEFGFWFAHWLEHRIFILWKFHEVHHSADVMTPFSAGRMHPVETFMVAGMQALCVTILQSLVFATMATELVAYSLFGRNVIMFITMNTIDHLRHSHLWIPFDGWLGRLLISPAHHQLHHSQDSAHQNRNFGLTLAVFDWLFGTLEIPGKQPLQNFGVANNPYQDGKLLTALVMPFVKIAQWQAGRTPFKRSSALRPKG